VIGEAGCLKIGYRVRIVGDEIEVRGQLGGVFEVLLGRCTDMAVPVSIFIVLGKKLLC